VSIVGAALLFCFLAWLAERRRSPAREQPCWGCGKPVLWVGLPTGWIHKGTGRAWEPYDQTHWLTLVKQRRPGDPPITFPHPAIVINSMRDI
jgi:hypothetical protein